MRERCSSRARPARNHGQLLRRFSALSGGALANPRRARLEAGLKLRERLRLSLAPRNLWRPDQPAPAEVERWNAARPGSKFSSKCYLVTHDDAAGHRDACRSRNVK